MGSGSSTATVEATYVLGGGAPVKAVAVVNPVAGRGRAARRWPQVRERLVAAGWSVDELWSEAPGHAVELAAEAARSGVDVVLAVGGDGTANEASNGLARSGALGSLSLGLVPLGTANDFAACLGIPLDVEGAVKVLASGRRRRVDLGQVNDRWFVNVAGVGFDAEVARWVNRRSKLVRGTAMYVAGIFRTLLRYQPTEVEVRLDGVPWNARAFLVAVGNSPAYAGGVRMCPDARPDDGELEVVRIGDVRKLEVFRILPLLYAGRHLSHPKVARAAAREVVVEARIPLAVHADGEPAGTTPARFRVQPGALWVLAP